MSWLTSLERIIQPFLNYYPYIEMKAILKLFQNFVTFYSYSYQGIRESGLNDWTSYDSSHKLMGKYSETGFRICEGRVRGRLFYVPVVHFRGSWPCVVEGFLHTQNLLNVHLKRTPWEFPQIDDHRSDSLPQYSF